LCKRSVRGLQDESHIVDSVLILYSSGFDCDIPKQGIEIVISMGPVRVRLVAKGQRFTHREGRGFGGLS
jgi:hypothetical protein